MSALEKLSKSLELLKSIVSSVSASDDTGMKSKEKISLCIIVADMICSPEASSSPNFQNSLSYAMETLFKVCNDDDSNIRMVAEECLNRIIRVHSKANVAKINVELHKEIKRNGNARSLRAALCRFAALAHMIRPIKRKPYLQSILPLIEKIANREEEAVLQTLASSLGKMLIPLGLFMTDNETKHLINVFMKNINNPNAVIRRAAAESILQVCLYCPRWHFFLVHSVNILLELVVPIKDQSNFTIIGVLNCIKGMMVFFHTEEYETYLKGSFGDKCKKKESHLSVESLLQIYELCLHWTYHEDHNVVTAALETLNVLFEVENQHFIAAVTGSNGLGKSRIQSSSNWKQSQRTLSELSVVTPAVDDSHLIDTEDLKWNQENSYLTPFDYPDSESIASEDLSFLLKGREQSSPEPEHSSERDSPSPPPKATSIQYTWNIGDPLDEPTLLYCARRLVTAFLIPECNNARVSVKALALSCLTQVVKLDPFIFNKEIDKNCQSTPQGFSRISDVTRFADDSDPQLMGLTRTLIGTLIHSFYKYGPVIGKDLERDFELVLQQVVTILNKGLDDENAICVRHTLCGLDLCLMDLLESNNFSIAIPILEKLLTVANNPYWLIKTKLCYALSSISFQSVYYITNNGNYQSKVENIFLRLLGNEDARVRGSVAETLADFVNNSYYPVDYNQTDIVSSRAIKLSIENFKNMYKTKGDPLSKQILENSLSRMIQFLTQALVTSSSKYLAYGCVESLATLSSTFSPKMYPFAWQCNLSSETTTSSGLFSLLVTILTSSPLAQDLEFQQWLLLLIGNLYIGIASNMKTDSKFEEYVQLLFTHLMKLMNIFVSVIEDNKRSVTSPTKKKLIRPTSPIKQHERESKEEKHLLGQTGSNPHYLKLRDIVRAGYANYKHTLDPSASEKFLSLTSQMLECTKQILSTGKMIDSRKHIDELLQYFVVIFLLDSTNTIKVVKQLIQHLFEKVDLEGSQSERNIINIGNFHEEIFIKPLQELSTSLERNCVTFNLQNEAEKEKIKEPRCDMEALTQKLILFEGIVIQSLKEYTMSTNIDLQVEVLSFLTQLVKLKVNYCLLDSDQIFIRFVKKQIEFLEAGQIRHPECLIAEIFKFFVSLCNEKHHSKAVISIPEIIQMLNGLMASGQDPRTHCIPAIIPVVHHVFDPRLPSDEKELETQRDVVLAILIRLVEYPEILDILYELLKDGWRWEDHWKVCYKQMISSIKPSLTEGRLKIKDYSTLKGLFSLNSHFYTPLSDVLNILFSHKQDEQTTEQWLAMITTMLMAVATHREDIILHNLDKMSLYVMEEGDDPLNVNTVSKTLPPQHLLARLFVRIIETSCRKIISLSLKPHLNESLIDFEKVFANFLLCCIQLFQSANFKLVSSSFSNLMKSNPDLLSMNNSYMISARDCPLLLLLWAKLLVIIELGDHKLWSSFITNSGRNSLNLEVVKRGCILLYCEYLVSHQEDLDSLEWLLQNNMEDIVLNCREPPVEKLLMTIYNQEKYSEVLLNCVSNVHRVDPVYTHKLLQTLKNVHSNFAGKVLCLVTGFLIEHKNIAVARLSAAFCCRTIEYMLTLEKDIVIGLLSKDDVENMIDKLASQKHCKRHYILLSLLRKLGEEYYDIFPPSDSFDVNCPVEINQQWFLEQISLRCSGNDENDGIKCARLLSKLENEELKVVMMSKGFDKSILQHCFQLGARLTLQKSLSSNFQIVDESLVPLYTSARTLLLDSIHKFCESIPDGNEKVGNLVKVFSNKETFKNEFVHLVTATTSYLSSFKDLVTNDARRALPENRIANLSKFGTLCVEAVNFLILDKERSDWPSLVQTLLECSSTIFSYDFISFYLTLEDISSISCCIFNLYKVLTGDDIPFKQLNDCDIEETNIVIESALLVSSLLCWLENISSNKLPKKLFIYIKSLIKSMGKNNKISWLCRLPIEAWQLPINQGLPSIPPQVLQDTDILYHILCRIKLLGWTGRLEFEEIWVCLLSALVPSPDTENCDQNELLAIMEANCLAVDGLTWLVLSTLSSSGYLTHIPRLSTEKFHTLPYCKRLNEMNALLHWHLKKVSGDLQYLVQIDKGKNLDKIDDSYGFEQLSVSYLQQRIAQEDTKDMENNSDIDIRSCIQFILDLYGQWTQPNSGISSNLQLTMVKSILCLSDMFTEINHYDWMLNTFLYIKRTHPEHDVILNQYLVIGIGKSAAVLKVFEGPQSENILKIIESSLKKNNLLAMAGIHSILYLLQSLQSLKVSEEMKSSHDFKQKLLQISIDYLNDKYTIDVINDENALLLTTLAMYLAETGEIPLAQLIKTFTKIGQSKDDMILYKAIVQGLERIALIQTNANEQITSFALDRFSQPDPKISLPALQLLLTCIYTDQNEGDGNFEVMEKTSAIFDKIKRGYPIEVEILSEILPGILSDFFPALDVLTKVIGEFLSPNQPHKKEMAAMVFQVFTQACSEQQLPLLQDWVVHSLRNFTQNLPIVTATWSLCCFFISASPNPWLRAMFPHVQSRIRQCDIEDRQILCIAAADFYKQLNCNQKEIFINSFKESSLNQKNAFSDILAYL